MPNTSIRIQDILYYIQCTIIHRTWTLFIVVHIIIIIQLMWQMNRIPAKVENIHGIASNPFEMNDPKLKMVRFNVESKESKQRFFFFSLFVFNTNGTFLSCAIKIFCFLYNFPHWQGTFPFRTTLTDIFTWSCEYACAPKRMIIDLDTLHNLSGLTSIFPTNYPRWAGGYSFECGGIIDSCWEK